MTHFGFGGFYTEMAAAKGQIGLVLCNTEPASNPFGGKGKILGTNPISFSCPAPSLGHPLTVDMATTAAARGKLLAHKMLGEPLPDFIAQVSRARGGRCAGGALGQPQKEKRMDGV